MLGIFLGIEVNFSIELLSGTILVSRVVDRINKLDSLEFNVQIYELLDKGYAHLSVSQ